MNGIIDEFCESEVANSIIKVIGIGGGGGNAVNYMYKLGIKDVTFAICNTDRQALLNSPIPTKIQIGTGLGAGNMPHVAEKAAEESREAIRKVLDDGTQMLFITAGMGGGTGTGAAPVVAEIARSLNILTVGIVTIPFGFEGKPKIYQALEGIAKISKSVDAILIINNDKIQHIYPDLDIFNAFSKSDDVVASAAKGIAEIVTITGHINVDFADVCMVMRNSGVAIMNSGYASGENRITKALEDALNSPLLNSSDISNTKRLLFSLYCKSDNKILADEIKELNDFVARMGDNIVTKWGITIDETLTEEVKVTLIATGSNISIVPDEYRVEMERREEEKKNTEEDPSEVPVPEVVKTPGKATNDWMKSLYPDIEVAKEKPTITLEMILEDRSLLSKLENESAYSRL